MRRLLSVGILTALTLLFSGCFDRSRPAQFIQPGVPFPDPGLVKTDTGWCRYSTITSTYGTVPVSCSSSLGGGWSTPKNSFPNPPAWTKGNFWAPEVQRFDGWYYLYFSATIVPGEHALGVARSSSPTGPFLPLDSVPGNAPPGGSDPVDPIWRNSRGVIDPEVVVNGEGRRYLIWSVDWGAQGRGGPNPRRIEGTRLAPGAPWLVENLNPAAPYNQAATKTLLTGNGPGWEYGTVEAPAMIWDGRWNLFYSGGNYEQTNRYATGWATCGINVLDPCTRAQSEPVVASQGGLHNPGGVDLVPTFYGSWAALGHSGYRDQGEIRESVLSYVTDK